MKSEILERLFILALDNCNSAKVVEAVTGQIRQACQGLPFRVAVRVTNQKDREAQKAVVAAVRSKGFLSACMAPDEQTIDEAIEDGFDVLALSNGSATDWPLLEKLAKVEKPMVINIGGISLEDVGSVIAFLQHRERDFALVHATRTAAPDLQLNQIDLLRTHFPQIRFGCVTPKKDSNLAVSMEVAKGCCVFELMLAVDETGKCDVQPEQIRNWLEAADHAFSMLGVASEHAEHSQEESVALLANRRAVYAKRDIGAGETIRVDDVEMKGSAKIGEITANDWSKYNKFYAKEAIKAGDSLTTANTKLENIRDKVIDIVLKVHDMLKRGNIVIPRGTKLELSHHFGLDKYFEYGAALITLVNRDYCKKVLVVLPGQKHPTHYHKIKDETLHVLYGNMRCTLNGETKDYTVGEMIVVEPGMPHSFESDEGCVFEEISTAHVLNDSVYTDARIGGYDERKSLVTYWHDCVLTKPGKSQLSTNNTAKSAIGR